jgi:hypothetical protein
MFEGLRLENVDIFYSHLEYFTDIGIFYDHLVHFVFIWYNFSGFGYPAPKTLATLNCSSHHMQAHFGHCVAALGFCMYLIVYTVAIGINYSNPTIIVNCT